MSFDAPASDWDLWGGGGREKERGRQAEGVKEGEGVAPLSLGFLAL